MKSILIVEDDITFSLMLQKWLEKNKFTVDAVSSILEAKRHIDKKHYDLILSDMRLPDQEGVDLLQWMDEKKQSIPCIVMTSYADIQSAVRTMKLGALDYIAKPFHPDDLLSKIEEALQTQNKDSRNLSTKRILTKTIEEDYIEGASPAAGQLYKFVHLVAPTNMSVLIQGASGTGKEHVAKSIHNLSNRADKAFIAIDCGAIPKDLAASEFFGHVKGSFTGALEDKKGAFIAANGGTIFLDEIGNLSYDTQIQLLRALQERIIRPIGSNETTQVDIRLIAATNEDLTTAINEGQFREDLFHRINEFTIQVPSLSERKEDIDEFAHFFLKKANSELGKQLEGFTEEAILALHNYSWPGNVRQLKNTIRKATLLAQGNLIQVSDFQNDLIETKSEDLTFNTPSTLGLSNSIELYDEQNEKQKILAALDMTNNNKSKAAKLLKIDRKTLYNKLKLYDIDL